MQDCHYLVTAKKNSSGFIIGERKFREFLAAAPANRCVIMPIWLKGEHRMYHTLGQRSNRAGGTKDGTDRGMVDKDRRKQHS